MRVAVEASANLTAEHDESLRPFRPGAPGRSRPCVALLSGGRRRRSRPYRAVAARCVCVASQHSAVLLVVAP